MRGIILHLYTKTNSQIASNIDFDSILDGPFQIPLLNLFYVDHLDWEEQLNFQRKTKQHH